MMPNFIFESDESIVLESGYVFPGFHLAYSTLGEMNEARDNIVWVFHALTANANPSEWWEGMVGKDKCFDPKKHFIICANIPGSPYGSISPLSKNPATEKKYHLDFPVFTITDIISCFRRLKEHLNISSINIGIGGSTGGMQLLEWAVQEPDLFKHIIPIATNAVHSAWGIAFNSSQRMAIEADSTWTEHTQDAGYKGMAAARTIALLSYRHYIGYALSQDRIKHFLPLAENVFYAADNYQRYQGNKLSNRFNVICYYRLTQSMDSHDLGKKRNGLENALSIIYSKTLIIAVKDDVLFPNSEQIFLQHHIKNALISTIESDYGHDGFLLESKQLQQVIKEFIGNN